MIVISIDIRIHRQIRQCRSEKLTCSKRFIQIIYKMPYICVSKDCNKRASFNVLGQPPLCCATHKGEDHINVRGARCQYNGCMIQPSYGEEGKNALFCVEHKAENHILVRGILCQYVGCKKSPTYGEEKGKALFCVEHKAENHVNVIHKRCQYPDCAKQPSYGEEWQKPLFCVEHKQDNHIDVVSKRCNHGGCTKRPIYGEDWKKPLFCVDHKQGNHIDVVSRRCMHEGCKKRPNYGEEWKKPLFCVEHKQGNHIDVVSRRCKHNGCTTQVCNKQYKGYCLRCFLYLFPDEQVSKNYKVKEKHVADFVKESYPNTTIIFDKAIQGGCSRKRPDIFIDLFTHSVIIEVDEEQHQDYSCENKRMMMLFEDLGSRPVVFLRFNPDKFVDKNGQSVSSCFQYHKSSGVPIIKSIKAWKGRLTVLKERIDYYIRNVPEKEVNIENLFYDGY